MRNYNTCAWLKIGTQDLCNKNCVKTYCKTHNYQINRGATCPRPCKKCGVGTNSESILCRPCGNAAAQMRLLRKEKEARRIYETVLVEILLKVNQH